MTGQTRSPQAFQARAQAQPAPNASCPALKVQLQKTKLCLFHLRSQCRDGANCRFAHGTEELQQQPDLSRTSMCPDMLEGKCTNPYCKYAHTSDEIRATNLCYKTTQCMWYAMGKCRNGTQCRFAHGEADRNTPALSVLTPEERVSEDVQKAGKKKKEKATQQRRAKEGLEIPEPSYINTESMMSITDQLQASQAYLNMLGMQHASLMGYPMAEQIGMPPGLATSYGGYPMMPGAGYDLYGDSPATTFYSAAANPVHVAVPESVSQESTGTNAASMKALSEHIQNLTEQVKKLQDKVNTNMRSSSGRSIYSGATSAVSGNTSNDDLNSSEVSETSQDLDGWGSPSFNVAAESQLA
eukprot:gnl/MRDRNA2_/MRDRNA2_92505_c0_seq1.p1 gnl/MRDRNA2_/MRDRNA2_92505_c0~~gnl/MRDRNA2_/MRDRNA2_92505_c0_seq1.p1  ORF type:complete len:386 (+),score=68.86 gnl/MRDRNA2_/MRDRNA2_92505_c0_seq1:94-1158(+)